MSDASDVEVRLAGDGGCDVVHVGTGATLRTSVSPEYGGRGTSFSSTDLLAAALATCIGSNLEPVALRHDIALGRIRVSASKTLSTAPKRVAALAVRIAIAGEVDEATRTRLHRAADACVVHRSLRDDVEVSIEIVAGDGA